MTESQARKAILRYAHQMHAMGWVANHDGNLSARIHRDRYLITPTGMSKADIGLDDLVVVDSEGKKKGGRRRPFSEMSLHRIIYDRRPDVGAVVHAHSPYATAIGVSGSSLPHPFLPEAVVSLGAEVPTVALSMPGPEAVKALEPYVMRCDAVLIAGNGILTWGPDLELAFLRAELVEHMSKISAMARPMGGVQGLPQEMVKALVAKRVKAGLAAPDEGKAVASQPRMDRLVDRAVTQLGTSAGGWSDAQVREIAREIIEGMGLDS